MFNGITVESIFGKGKLSDAYVTEYDADLYRKIEQYAWEVLNINNYEGEYDGQNIELLKDFQDWLYDDISVTIDDLKDVFISLISGNIIEGWREMSVNKKWLTDLKNGKINKLGIFWSYEEDAAEPHWGYGANKKYIRLKADININAIDWISTFRANLYPSLGEDEKEITMKENRNIKLVEMKLLENSTDEDGKLVRLTPKILNKTYKA